jgi:hypothetical protein
MAQTTSKTSNIDDSDFGSHLQRRLGINLHELGECLTKYRPSRPYSIVLGSDCSPSGVGAEPSAR